MIKAKELVKHCVSCKSEGATSSVVKVVNKKYNKSGVEQVMYKCCVCENINIYENNVLVDVKKC